MPTAPFADPASPISNPKYLEPHRESLFQNLWIGHACVRHMALDRVTAIKPVTRTSATCNGFIVLEVRVAPDKIVHRSLGSSHHAKRTKKRIAHRL